MLQIERWEEVLRYINRMGTANTEQLAHAFSVSKVTVRRDIEALAGKGLIVKTHGGAVSVSSSLLSYEIPYHLKSEVNISAKRRIGLTASKLISDGDIIILDAGSTTLEVAKNIDSRDVTVLTDDIKITLELTQKKNAAVMVSGGSLLRSVYTLTGNQTVDFFKKAHVNKTFLACDALDVDFGVSNRSVEEVAIKLAMIHAADEVIMVTDSSKLHKKVFQYLCDLSQIHTLIIDEIDGDTQKAIEGKGVEVIVAGT